MAMERTAPVPLALAPQAVEVVRRPDGTMILTSPQPLGPTASHVGEWLRRWAAAAPRRLFLAERLPGSDGWRRLRYGEAAAAAAAIGQGLLDLGLSAERPLLLLSGNGIDHALLALGAMGVGVPVVPVSPAYSLASADCLKVRYIAERVRPGAIYARGLAPFRRAIEAVGTVGLDARLILSEAPPAGLDATTVERLRETPIGRGFREATERVGPDSVAKILFTSGSTGFPKGVINTQRMLTANQQMIAQCWPFLDAEKKESAPEEKKEPAPEDDSDGDQILCDWLPWNHTFGGNHNFHLVLRGGGTLYIDGGRPLPGAAGSSATIAETVRNLREISPTLYFNVPAGFAALLPYLEADEGLCRRFFARLQLLFYAGAALPQDLWDRMERVAVRTTGRRPRFVSSWGTTETAPMATSVHYPIERAGIIGLPAPGVELKLAPSGSKLELRVRGPNVSPGYFASPELTQAAFDEEGFYRTGDGGRLADPERPELGLCFDGRVSEDFKLLSGTWVHVGALRVAALAATSPLLLDAVVAGHDRSQVGLLAWPAVSACRVLGELPATAPLAEVLRHPAVRRRIVDGLQRLNADLTSGSRVARVLLLEEPPLLDQNEITDKGYVNQRAVLERRSDQIAALYAEPPTSDVIEVWRAPEVALP